MSTNTRAPLPTPQMVISGLRDAGLYIPIETLNRGLEIAHAEAQSRHIQAERDIAREMAIHDARFSKVLEGVA